MTTKEIIAEFVKHATPLDSEKEGAGYFITSGDMSNLIALIALEFDNKTSAAYNDGYKAGYDCSLLDNQRDFK